MNSNNTLKTACPICHTTSSLEAHGIIAPWVAQLIQKKFMATTLRKCDKCTLKFFTYRYSEQETKNLYGSYRSDKYYKLRHSWEPWFSKTENDAYNPSENSSFIQSRVDFMTEKLREAEINHDFNSCVDFGGDLGQFFPPSVKGNKYLVDFSAQSGFINDVRVVSSLIELPEKMDLVINCMVLEHMSNLDDSITKFESILSNVGVLYVEIPLDSFKTSKFHRTILYERYLFFISGIKPIFILIDFIGGVSRQLWGRVPWFGIVKQSEHINYFSEMSMMTFSNNFNGNVIISQPDLKFKQGKFKLGRLAIIMSKSKKDVTKSKDGAA